MDDGVGDRHGGQVGGWCVQGAGGEGGQVGAVAGGDPPVEVPGVGGEGGRGGVAVQGLPSGQRLAGADGVEVGAVCGAAELGGGDDAATSGPSFSRPFSACRLAQLSGCRQHAVVQRRYGFPGHCRTGRP